MATISPLEAQVLTRLRELERHLEFTLTISGFQRGGKRQYRLQPSFSDYLTPDQDAFLAVD